MARLKWPAPLSPRLAGRGRERRPHCASEAQADGHEQRTMERPRSAALQTFCRPRSTVATNGSKTGEVEENGQRVRRRCQVTRRDDFLAACLPLFWLVACILVLVLIGAALS